MQHYANVILWVYIVLLFIGGMIGYLKANSKASLIASASFAAVLILCNINVIFKPEAADIVLVVLLIFFSVRLVKSKKMMPNGVMAILTIVTLALRHIRF